MFQIIAYCLSSNKELLATADANGRISVWSTQDERQLATLDTYNAVATVDFTRGDETLVAWLDKGHSHKSRLVFIDLVNIAKSDEQIDNE